jgi:hypothetical protein
MTDREDVINGLECIVSSGNAGMRDDCANCVYPGGGDCLAPALQDALALLKAQEPRVMTLEEVLNAEKSVEPLWCEFIDCALGSWRMGWKLKTEGKREVQHILENPLERAIVWESEYEKGWRCWTAQPNQAEMEARPWPS